MSGGEVPPIVATAHLLLRGLVPSLLGCPVGSGDIIAGAIGSGGGAKGKGWVQASAFQMTYRKDLPRLGREGGGYTGKLSWNLGKKWGTEAASLPLPREEDLEKKEFNRQCKEFWMSVEKAANRLINSAGLMTKKYDYESEEMALQSFGMGVMDAGQCGARDKRKKKAEKARKEGKEVAAMAGNVSVGHLMSRGGDTFALALLHGTNLVPLSRLGSIKILCDNPKNESNLVCSKKKCEVTVKFCVVPLDDDAGIDAVITAEAVELESLNVGACMSKEIRLEEGSDFETYMWRMAMEVEAAKEASAATQQEAALANAATVAELPDGGDEMVVTAFEVSGSIDYTKLIENFGSRPLTPYLLRRLENVTVKRGTVPRLHRFLRREIFFSHRDIEKICELLEGWYGVGPPPEDEAADASGGGPPAEMETPGTPCPIYLYTGRGPSSAAMHLGHLVPFLFTAWLQRAFRCPLVIQMTDDEKFLFKGEYSGDLAGDGTGPEPDRTGDNLDRFANLTIENAKDIVACDFLPDKTFLFSDLDYVGRMYPNIVRIWKAVTANQVNNIFGFDGGANIGKVAFPAVQAAPSFGSSFPNVLGGGGGKANPATLACLIPCAIDQDPYFRLTRDIAHKLVPRQHPLGGKPALIHSKFFPPLQGAQGKMSSSNANSAVFLTDTPEDIERKIKAHAFSGGRDTKKLQEELGADLDVDVSYQWLRFFLEDDEELVRIGREYGSGKGEYWSTGKVKARLVRIGREYGSGKGEYWSTGKVKARLVEVLKELVAEHQERRSRVTEEVVRKWMSERCIVDVV